MLTLTLTLNSLVTIILPVIIYRYYKNKYKLPKRIFWVGVLTFITIQLLESAALKFLGVIDMMDVGLNPAVADTVISITTVMIQITFFSAFFTEISKYFAFKRIISSVDSYRSTILFGIGFAGIKMIAAGIATGMLAFSLYMMPNIENNPEVLSQLTDEQQSQFEVAKGMIGQLQEMPAYLPIISIFEQIGIALLAIALTMVVFSAVVFRKWFLVIGAIILNGASYLLLIYLTTLHIAAEIGFLLLISTFSLYLLNEYKKIFKVTT